MSNAALPSRCDVLVVGAGPSGAACAQFLARAGVDVVLVDQHDFPRDKVCGDGLIPDAHHALERLGVYAEVMAAARQLPSLACVGPRGGRVEVPGRVAMLPRLELDDIVCRAAVRAGAKLHTPWRFDAPLLDGERVVGALLKQGDATCEVSARWVVLATGALPQPLLATGMCTRRAPSGIGLRAYVKNDAMVERIRTLEVVWDKRTAPGYGWIFPAPGGRFNIGVGIGNTSAGDDATTAKMKDVNLRQVFDSFCEFHEPARELMRTGTLEGGVKGAPLRFSLTGRARREGRPAGHRRGRGQHLRVHRRGHRQGARDGHARGRGAAGRAGRRALRRFAGGARALRREPGRPEAALRSVRARQPDQRAPVAGRPGDLACPPQPAPAAQDVGRARGDQQPRQPDQRARAPEGVLSWRVMRKTQIEQAQSPSA
jgi:choline dehydrogenase-like flavoprotein